MLIKKGTLCRMTCCDRPAYRTQFDFTPKLEPYGERDGILYLRGRCFPCLLATEIAPELKKAGIELTEETKKGLEGWRK